MEFRAITILCIVGCRLFAVPTQNTLLPVYIYIFLYKMLALIFTIFFATEGFVYDVFPRQKYSGLFYFVVGLLSCHIMYHLYFCLCIGSSYVSSNAFCILFLWFCKYFPYPCLSCSFSNIQFSDNHVFSTDNIHMKRIEDKML